MSRPDPIVDEVWLDRPIGGSSLYESVCDGHDPTLRDQLDPVRPTLFVFLRHLGCAFAPEMVRDVRVAAEERSRTDRGGTGEVGYPRVIFVHTAGPRGGGRFLGKLWPAAAAVSDPTRRLYDAAGFPCGGLGQIVGPRTWPARLRVRRRLPRVGGGDFRTMPGLLLLAPDGRVLRRHDFRRVGERFDFGRFALGGDAPHERYKPCSAM